jgi:hypothetical protein
MDKIVIPISPQETSHNHTYPKPNENRIFPQDRRHIKLNMSTNCSGNRKGRASSPLTCVPCQHTSLCNLPCSTENTTHQILRAKMRSESIAPLLNYKYQKLQIPCYLWSIKDSVSRLGKMAGCLMNRVQ